MVYVVTCRFINFYETAITDSALGYVIAFLVLLATVKFWSLLHLNPKMHLITSSMERAWGNLLGLLLIMLVLLVSYSSIVSKLVSPLFSLVLAPCPHPLTP